MRPLLAARGGVAAHSLPLLALRGGAAGADVSQLVLDATFYLGTAMASMAGTITAGSCEMVEAGVGERDGGGRRRLAWGRRGLGRRVCLADLGLRSLLLRLDAPPHPPHSQFAESYI